MAGHAHSANIAARKGAVDKKRSKNFNKFSVAIMSAVRQAGPDPDANLKLRYAIEKARAGNMPKENIERVIKRASGEAGGDAIEELVYEGYAPGGVALVIVCMTDNRHRTAPDIKHILEKNGGNLGAPGSVSFQFSFQSIVGCERGGKGEDWWMESALECGFDDVRVEGDYATLLGPATAFLALKTALEARIAGGECKLVSAEVGWIPSTSVPIADREEARRILHLIELLEDNDDVQNVYANYDIPAAWLAEPD
jgi:YebC/PmpR family DNA-binding regulatory protein